jgi:hypothetical protein
MKKYFSPLVIVFTCLVPPAFSQAPDSLNVIKSKSALIYYSAGHAQRAGIMAKRVEKAISWYQELLAFKPIVTLMVLSPADWKKHALKDAVYGMPHHNPLNKTLYVAAEDNPFWKSFLPPLGQLPPGLGDQVQKVYKNNIGSLSMQDFFDLLALHELGHAFHTQAGLNMQRKWMGELFVNILLHAYIAENEPGFLPALTLFPKMVVAGGSKEFKFTSLQDVDKRYDEIARDYPKNYGWYQCRWHAAAARIYDAAGKDVGKKLWTALKNKNEKLSDEQMVAFLETYGDKTVADLIRNWNAQ